MQDNPTPSPTVGVLDAVATEKGVDSTALPPLADSIDPEALDALLDSMDDADRADAHVQFGYYGHTVQITPDHTVTVD